MSNKVEDLPPGVGHVPRWWMEETPHYTLDVEAENARLMAEDQMAHYYQQMAAADDAGLLDEHGNPILGPDGKPVGGWGGPNGWAGRGAGGSGGDNGLEDGPLGRNFVPGQVTPELLNSLGVGESHPDYRSFLTGAKFPPGYWEKLADLGYTGPGFNEHNNMAQTDYGRYGRQAESPRFKPSWMKKKLRSTASGSAIRKGKYEDVESPGGRGGSRRVLAADGDDDGGPSILNIRSPHLGGGSAAPTAADQQQQQQQQPPTQNGGEAPRTKKLVRKVRKVHRKKRDPNNTQQQAAAAPAPAPAAVAAPPRVAPKPKQPEPHQEAVSYQKYSHKDYYHNAPAHQANAGGGAAQKPAPPAPKQVVAAPAPIPAFQSPPPQQQQQQQHHEDTSEYEEEEIIEEEIIEDEYEEIIEEEEYTDGYDEVLLSPDASTPGGGGEEAAIPDLQAILAAKQAELARLQAQLM